MSISFLEPEINKLQPLLDQELRSPSCVSAGNRSSTSTSRTRRSSSKSSARSVQSLIKQTSGLKRANSNELSGTPRSILRKEMLEKEKREKQDSGEDLDDDSSEEEDDDEEFDYSKRVAFDTITIKYHNCPDKHIPIPRTSFSSSGNIDSNSNSNRPTNLFQFPTTTTSAATKPPIPLHSYSVSCKHKDFESSNVSRTFLCALSSVPTSWSALEWLVEHVMEDGDELLCLKVEKESTKMSTPSQYKLMAESLLERVVQTIAVTNNKNDDEDEESNQDNGNVEPSQPTHPATKKRVNVIVELARGSIRKIVRHAILLYQPAMVLVGTSLRQYQKVMRYFSKRTTLSNYFVCHSPVPILLVMQEALDHQGKDNHGNGDGVDVKEGIESDGKSFTIEGGLGSENKKTSRSLSRDEDKRKKVGESGDYLSFLTNREHIQVDDEDVKQNYRSLFADWNPDESSSSTTASAPLTTTISRTSRTRKISGSGMEPIDDDNEEALLSSSESTNNLVLDVPTIAIEPSSSQASAKSSPSSSGADAEETKQFKVGYRIEKVVSASGDGRHQSIAREASPCDPCKSLVSGETEKAGKTGQFKSLLQDKKIDPKEKSGQGKKVTTTQPSSQTLQSTSELLKVSSNNGNEVPGSSDTKTKRRRSFFGAFMRRKS